MRFWSRRGWILLKSYYFRRALSFTKPHQIMKLLDWHTFVIKFFFVFSSLFYFNEFLIFNQRLYYYLYAMTVFSFLMYLKFDIGNQHLASHFHMLICCVQVMSKHKISHQRYHILMTRILNVSPHVDLIHQDEWT